VSIFIGGIDFWLTRHLVPYQCPLKSHPVDIVYKCGRSFICIQTIGIQYCIG